MKISALLYYYNCNDKLTSICITDEAEIVRKKTYEFAKEHEIVAEKIKNHTESDSSSLYKGEAS